MVLILASLLAASPEPLSIGITPLQLIQMPAELAGFSEDRLAIVMNQRGYKVTTPADIQALLGLERQRQLLGCSEDSSCMTEIASALGVPLIVVGRVSKIEDRVNVDLRVIRQRDAQVVASDTRSADGIKQLGSLVEEAAASLARQLAPKAAFAWKLWVPFVAGVTAAGVGAALWALAESAHFSWTNPGYQVPMKLIGLSAIDAEFRRLQDQRTLGIALVSAGAGLIAAGFVLNALWPEPLIQVAFVPQANGATVAVGGAF